MDGAIESLSPERRVSRFVYRQANVHLVLVTERAVVEIYARPPAEERRLALAVRCVADDTPRRRPPAPAAAVRELQ